MSGGAVTVPWLNYNFYGVRVGMNGGTGVLTLSGSSLFDATANASTLSYQGYGNIIQIGSRRRRPSFCWHSHRRGQRRPEGRQRHGGSPTGILSPLGKVAASAP